MKHSVVCASCRVWCWRQEDGQTAGFGWTNRSHSLLASLKRKTDMLHCDEGVSLETLLLYIRTEKQSCSGAAVKMKKHIMSQVLHEDVKKTYVGGREGIFSLLQVTFFRNKNKRNLFQPWNLSTCQYECCTRHLLSRELWVWVFLAFYCLSCSFVRVCLRVCAYRAGCCASVWPCAH